MEIEKPRTKHKKKKKVVETQVSHNSSFLEDVENDFNDLGSLDIDFPNLLLDSPKLLEKSVKSEEQTPTEAFEQVPGTSASAESVKHEETSKPTAPLINEPGPSTSTSISFENPHFREKEKVAYPKLENLNLNSDLTVPQKAKIKEPKMKPFSEIQMQQLYSNNQLKLIEQFETEFINRELQENQKQTDHVLYQLLRKYANSRNSLKQNLNNMNLLKKTSSDHHKKVWKTEARYAYRNGSCSRGHPVKVCHRYDEAIINEDVMESLTDSLRKLLTVSCCDYTKSSYDSQLYVLQIDHIVRELICSPQFAEITTRDYVSLKDSVDQRIFNKVAELRLCVSIFFIFLRDISPDKEFTANVRKWVTQLVSLQLRIATWQDHLFILYHLLRCPVGVGSWASSLVQVPLESDDLQGSPFALPEFQHCVAFLSALLMPIKERNAFLEKITKDLNTSIEAEREDIWVLVDSDGEEGNTPSGECAGLKENDLVAFIDQIPIEKLFRLITFTDIKDGEYEMKVDKITGHHLIKCIAFATTFIGILKRGLVNYDTERYKQFAKRLGRLTKHMVFCIADMIKIFKNSSVYKDVEECQRIQVEFDNLMIRASNYIYDSQKLSLWQYLMDFPYELMNIKSLWSLYFFLNVGDFSLETDFIDISSSSENYLLIEKFNNSIVDVPSDDLYFLLQSFSQMALARTRDDWAFISQVTMNLLKIGFLNESTRDNCYKTVKDLLFNITSKYPELISDILVVLKGDVKDIGSLSPYLCKALPISKWNPEEKDLEILASWLLNFPYESPESTTARVIFTSLNWNFNQNDELFLPYDLHVRMACLVCEVYMKHIGETVGSGVQETLRLVSNMLKNQSKKEQFSIWCWNMISVLRLHYMDQCPRVVMNLLNDTSIIRQIPELEKTGSVYQAYSEQRPLGVFCSILMSQIGHSVPQICHKGFDQLKLLLNDYRYSKVIRCLELMTPLFLECPESLINCDSFHSVLMSLLAADKTYSKIAKDLIGMDGKGPVLSFFGNMLQSQLINYPKYGLQSPSQLISLWINCFTKVPNWNKDLGIVYLLELMARIAYQFPDCWMIFREHFRFYFTKLVEVKVPKSSGLLTLISSSSEKDIVSSPSEDAVWLSLMFLELEFEVLEVQTGFWAQFLSQLHLNSNNAFVNILKKSISLVNLQSFPQECLVIYKLANLITKTSTKHPVLPILCQQFFTIYMSRVPILTDEVFYDRYGVQEKFYEADISLMKKLKKCLADAETFYNSESLKEYDDYKKQFYSECARLFKTYLLWLEESQINKFTQSNIVLPPQYNVEKLKFIFAGKRDHWTEFLPLQEIREKQKHCANSWVAINYRSNLMKSLESAESLRENDTPQSKIFARFSQFPIPKSPPELVKKKPVMGEIDIGNSTLFLLRTEYKILESFARRYSLVYKEHSSLDGNFLDLLRNLFRNEPAVRMVTGSCGKEDDCNGGTTLRVEFRQLKFNDSVRTKIEDNREQHFRLIKKHNSPPEEEVVKANFTIQNIISQLLEKHKYYEKNGDKAKCQEIFSIGSKFFYDILKSVNENIQICPITHELCSDSISNLGLFVQQNQQTESLTLLKLALSQPNLVNLIAELFKPSVCPPKYFLEMYVWICNSYKKGYDPQLLFVLMTKFDINNWLEIHKPKNNDVTTLLQLILKGLELWQYQNSDLIQDVLLCHLSNVFDYQFPLYFNEVIQNILIAYAGKHLKPTVLKDLLNGLYQKVGCDKLELSMEPSKLKYEFRNFASKQNKLSYEDVKNIVPMLSNFFYSERLQYGLHGLYTNYETYCESLSQLFGTIGHSLLVSAIHAYPGMIADQLINWLWPCLNDLFSPWLVPYHPNNMKDAPAKWIQQFTGNTSVLLPWSELQEKNAQKILQVFQMCLQFMFEMLPASNLLLSHLFIWYESNFAYKGVPAFVLNPIHKILSAMPWERFRPGPIHMDGFFRVFSTYVPECHVFAGNVFLRIAWTPWLHQNIQSWDYQTLQRMLSQLLSVLIKVSYEPTIRGSIKILTLLKESLKYPWHLLEYNFIECVFDWFVMSTEPSVILNMPSEHRALDEIVLNLLKIVSSIKPQSEDVGSPSNSFLQNQAKRILYVRSIVRLLKGCGTKMNQEMPKKQSQQQFQDTCVGLLDTIAECLSQSNSKDKEMESKNLMFEIIGSIDSQSELISKLFTESIIFWENASQRDKVMLSGLLSAMSLCKGLSLNLCHVLETTLQNYLKPDGPLPSPTWREVHHKLGPVKIQTDTKMLINDNLLLVLHWSCFSTISKMENDVDRVNHLQTLQQYLADLKTTEENEGKLALLWGFAIVNGGIIMKRSNASKNQLLILARYFQVMNQQTEGWGEGLLGAIGLKRDGQTNKKKILSRCLACVIFSLFSDQDSDPNVVLLSKEYENSLSDLKSVLSNKKFSDVRTVSMQALSLIESNAYHMLENFPATVTQIINLFYEDSFLSSVLEFWS